MVALTPDAGVFNFIAGLVSVHASGRLGMLGGLGRVCGKVWDVTLVLLI